MKMKLFIIVILINFLTCEKAEWNLKEEKPSVIATVYPFNGQKDVPVTSGIYISFTVPVDEETVFQNFILTSGNESTGGELYISPDKKFLRFKPASPLTPLTEYKIKLTNIQTEDGKSVALPEDGVISSFVSGSGRPKVEILKVSSYDPPPDSVFDFSTFRFTLTEPVDERSVELGGTFKFINVETGGVVSGNLIVRDTKIIFDPDEDLTPGKQYRIEMTDIFGIDGSKIEHFEMDFVPQRTVPRREIKLRVFPDFSDVESDIKNLPFSGIVGIPYNSIEIDSRIIGKTYSIMKGFLVTEMADLNSYSEYIPVVIRKGQKILATSSRIKLGGEIDTLQESGLISLTLVTDATGIIKGNPFKEYNMDSPPAVYFTLDACLTAENPVINATLNQENINVQLFGTLSVDGDNLMIQTGGTTEIDIMGAEKASVTLALKLESTTEEVPPDNLPPAILTVTPVNGEESVPVESAVTITFSEPIKEYTVDGRVEVSEPAGNINGRLNIKGSSIIFKPEGMLKGGTTYTIRVKPGIEDLNGNKLDQDFISTFVTEIKNPDSPQALLVSSIYPGVPCILKNPNSIPPGDAGECLGSDDDTKKFNKFVVPYNHDVTVYFTKILNKNSVTDNSFLVRERETLLPVTGTRIVSGKKVTFIPDTPWIISREYELVLKGGSDSICDTDEICDVDGLPLNTDVLDDGSENPGGAELIIPFVGGNFSNDSILALSLVRYTDTNSNGIVDITPPSEHAYDENSVIIRNASDNTPLGITYLSGVMISMIKGFDPSKNAVTLESLPGNWLFGTSSLIIILNTERMLMRPAGSATGYILKPAPSDPDQRPVLKFGLETWLNPVNDIADLALEDTPKTMELEGRVDFLSDGRMSAVLTNTNTVYIGVLGGLITLAINPGDIKVRLETPFRY